MLKNCHEKWDILKLLAFWKLHFWVFALKINLRRTKNSLSIKMRNVCLGLGVWRYGNVFFPWIKKELSVLPCLSSGLRFLTQDWRVLWKWRQQALVLCLGIQSLCCSSWPCHLIHVSAGLLVHFSYLQIKLQIHRDVFSHCLWYVLTLEIKCTLPQMSNYLELYVVELS